MYTCVSTKNLRIVYTYLRIYIRMCMRKYMRVYTRLFSRCSLVKKFLTRFDL